MKRLALARRAAWVTMLALSACSPPPAPADAGPDVADATPADAPAEDTPEGGSDTGVPPCGSDAACSDGLYCNGVERCAPSAHGADARGCIAGPPPCAGDAGMRCDEALDQCVSTDCADPDHDHDGENKPGCGGNDCNDNDATVHHGAAEVCDGAGHDEDCDPCTVASRPSAGSPTDGDTDADGFISTACTNAYAGSAPTTCDPVAVRVGGGLVTGSDCAPDDPNRRPNQVEACNHVDDNCNGQTDENLATRAYYPDADGDTYGATDGAPVVDCTNPTGYVSDNRDCDDTVMAVHPSATEACDGIDSDCSLPVRGPETSEDADGDRHAGLAARCLGGPFPKDDCNDADPTVYRNATELCDRVDNDCSLIAGAGGVDPAEDRDSDGHAAPTAACAGGPLPKDDCNDNDANFHPGIAEQCDRVDNDCSSGGGVAVDEDQDNDGHAPVGGACAGGPLPEDDCNDNDPAVHPGVDELCDGVDQNCNGATDDDSFTHPMCGTTRLTCRNVRCVDRSVVTAANYHSCAVRGTGALYCWGYNGYGQLGDGTTTNRLSPTLVTTLGDVASVAAGINFTCARRNAGDVWCWGINTYGQLGDGSGANHTLPVQVVADYMGTPLTGVVEIAAGDEHACARRSTGDVVCWGRGFDGRLGIGSNSTLFYPYAGVAGLTDAIAISAGRAHTCAVHAGGAVSCWGENYYGQLGTGTVGGVSYSPTDVVGVAGAVDVVAANTWSCALLGSGAVQCWTGTTTQTVGGLSEPVVAIGASGTQTCASGASGAMACWTPGNAAYDASLAGVVDIGKGNGHQCMRLASNSVVCRGWNDYGQLGSGMATSYGTTATVVGLP